jgi:hypothetical protein
MPLRSGLIVTLSSLLYLRMAWVSIEYVLLNPEPDNKLVTALIAFAAGFIALASCVLLVAYAVVIARKGQSRQTLRCFTAGVLLLVLQLGAHGLARDIDRKARFAVLEASIEIRDLNDVPLLDLASQVVGINLSFTLVTDSDLRLVPMLWSGHLDDDTGILTSHFSTIKFIRMPPYEGSDLEFRKGEAYRLTYHLVPWPISWDSDTDSFCLSIGDVYPTRWVETIRPSLPPGRQRFTFHLLEAAASVQTHGRYDLFQMLDQILSNGPKPCPNQGLR